MTEHPAAGRLAVWSPNGSASSRDLVDHVIELPSGQRVGVTLGGQGVPILWLPGLGYARRNYRRILQTIVDAGFSVIGIDGAGHGDTDDLRWGDEGFASPVRMVLEVIDALVVERVVVAGHSMGGRLAIELTARAPQRVLAAVLINVAAGAEFDEMIASAVNSGANLMRPRQRAVESLPSIRPGEAGVTMGRYVRLLMLLCWVASGRAACDLRTLAQWLRALAKSTDSSAMLKSISGHRIPTIIIHGEADRLVPMSSAHDAARAAGAQLFVLCGHGHSWLLSHPICGATVLGRLLARELRDVLHDRYCVTDSGRLWDTCNCAPSTSSVLLQNMTVLGGPERLFGCAAPHVGAGEAAAADQPDVGPHRHPAPQWA